MSIVAVIPARSGSKGVPDKNIKYLAGTPLIVYSIAVAKKSKLINRIIVSTDSKKYADLAKKYGAEAPFLRPAELASDISTDYEFVKHLLDWLKLNENYQPDYLVHLRPTTPLRDPEIVDSAIKALMGNPEATSLRSAHEMSQSAYKTFEVEGKYLKCVGTGSFDLDSANKPRQSFETTYDANGYVDVLKTRFILENQMIHGNRVMAFITPRAFEVDTIEDFEYLTYKCKDNNEDIVKLFEKI